MGPQPPCEAFGAATSVFIGKVERLISKPLEIRSGDRVAESQNRNPQRSASRGAPATKAFSPPQVEVVFSVERAFVGVGEPQVSVFTGEGDGDCGYRFQVGQRYLVYTSQQPGASHLSTSTCTNTKPLADAGKDLEFLRQLPPAGTGATVEGRVVRVTSDPVGGRFKWHVPIKGVPILLHRDEMQYETMTNDQGQFRIRVQQGEYKVRAVLADHFDQEYASKTIRVNDGGCARTSFNAEPGGRIRGRVFDAAGMPKAGVEVDLISPDANETGQPQKGTSAMTDKEGSFDFQRLAPGRYLLGINLRMPPNSQQPYSPIYYPAAPEAAQAQAITIGLGEQTTGHDLRLPTRLVGKAVRGTVVWPDGLPAYIAHVSLYDLEVPGVPAQQTGTDPRGEFTLEGYVGRTYQLKASSFMDQPAKLSQKMHAEPLVLRLDDSVSGLKLILASPEMSPKTP